MEKQFDEIADLACQNVMHVFKKCKSKPDMFTHYATLISLLGKCYIESDHQSVLVARIDGDLAIVSVNANEMEAIAMVNDAHDFVMRKAMNGAPEKAMFN